MRKPVIHLIFLLLFFQTSLLAYSSNPKQFINELINDAISNLSNKNLTLNEKEEFIKKISLENVDIDALGLYTLGELRKSSNENDISKYQKTFEKYFLKNLTARLKDYSSSKFEIIGEDKKSTTYTIISSKIFPIDGGPEIKIDWRVYTKNPDKPLIRDLIIEGLSLARTQKEEFNSIIQSNDGDIKVLFENLRNFSKK